MTDQFSDIAQPDGFQDTQQKTFRDYLNIVLLNIVPITIILLISAVISIYHANSLKDIYRSTTKLKIDDPKGSILTRDILDVQEQRPETFILTQIELLKSYYIRDLVAEALTDSLKNYKDETNFSVLIHNIPEQPPRIATKDEIRRILAGVVKFEQPVKKVNMVEISCSNPDFNEAKLITTTYSNAFVEYSKVIGRLDITAVKNYLADEKQKKFNELLNSESSLQDFQKRTGLISLEAQASQIVNTISTYDAAKNNNEIEIRAVKSSLNILNQELNKIDPEFTKYIENQFNTSYVEGLTKKISELEVNRDLELSLLKDDDSKQKVRNTYNEKIAPLKISYEEKVKSIKEGILVKTPEAQVNLTDKILESKLTLSALNEKNNIISGVLRKYESQFNQLPEKSIELARLERDRKSTEKLYLLLEEKFQEASINERARIGNATLLDPGTDNSGPVGPNRMMIIFTGVGIGLLIGLVYAFGKDYLDRSIKDPEELEKRGISLLSWIPSIDELQKVTPSERLLITEHKKGTTSEAFKALRTRIQYSKLKEFPLKTILITSSLPSEGKTFVSANLAATFALSDKKTLLLDCDLRKPKVHSLFASERYPGLCDLLYNNFELKDVTRTSKIQNLSYITCGTLAPNPSELLGSEQMSKLLKEISNIYDIIIIDSPPFLSVTDAEILFNITDGAILIAKAGKTHKEAFYKTYSRLKSINAHNLLGCVLNDFSFRKAYSYYYYNNYYYYYSYSGDQKKKKLFKSKT